MRVRNATALALAETAIACHSGTSVDTPVHAPCGGRVEPDSRRSQWPLQLQRELPELLPRGRSVLVEGTTHIIRSTEPRLRSTPYAVQSVLPSRTDEQTHATPTRRPRKEVVLDSSWRSFSPPAEKPSMRASIAWGIVVGVAQAATPLAFWWLDAATVYAVGLAVIAPVYIGFAVADGRVRVIVVECLVAMAFVVIATAGIKGSAWLLAFGLAAHGVKDAWQHRRQFVSGTRWWPPFCAAVDWVVALIIGIEIVVGVHFHSS